MPVYLPDLDPDGDCKVDLYAIHDLKFYYLFIYDSTGENDYNHLFNTYMVEAEKETETYSTFLAEADNLKGLGHIPGNIVGWSFSVGGSPITGFPLASEREYGDNLKIYALTE